MKLSQINSMNHQRGATLIVALIILLVLTLTAVTSMRTTTLEEKMVSNTRDYNLSFEAAEVALRSAENWLAAQTFTPILNNSGSNGVWPLGVPPAPDATNLSWWGQDADSNGLNNGVPISLAFNLPNGIPNTQISEVVSQPQFYIEELLVDRSGESIVQGFSSDSVKVYHQVTAMGRGSTNNSVSILQSTFVRRYE